MVKVGQKMRFDPFKDITGFASNNNRGRLVTGTVMFVSEQNKWFSLEYNCGGVKQRASFRFSQIGKDVLICG